MAGALASLAGRGWIPVWGPPGSIAPLRQSRSETCWRLRWGGVGFGAFGQRGVDSVVGAPRDHRSFKSIPLRDMLAVGLGQGGVRRLWGTAVLLGCAVEVSVLAPAIPQRGGGFRCGGSPGSIAPFSQSRSETICGWGGVGFGAFGGQPCCLGVRLRCLCLPRLSPRGGVASVGRGVPPLPREHRSFTSIPLRDNLAPGLGWGGVRRLWGTAVLLGCAVEVSVLAPAIPQRGGGFRWEGSSASPPGASLLYVNPAQRQFGAWAGVGWGSAPLGDSRAAWVCG